MRKMIFLISGLLFLFAAIAPWGRAEIVARIQDPKINPSSALTLAQCYQLALKRSESVAIKNEMIQEAQGQLLQAFSGTLPEVNFENAESYQDGPAHKRDHLTIRKFTFSQPLFTGFKEFAAIAASRAQKRQNQAELKRAQQLLYIDVADAYLFVLNYDKQYKALLRKQAALKERITELQKRVELGKSRSSEVVSSQASLSRLEADMSAVVSDMKVSHQLLSFLIGRSVDELAEPDFKKMNQEDALEQYLAKVEQRPDVMAEREALKVARQNVAVARSGFFPAVTADGQYYTKREGTFSAVDWEGGITVEVPLFKGGETVGKVKEAQSLARQAELTSQQTRRKALLEIENVYTQWQEVLKQVQFREKAYQDSITNYQMQKEDYQRNQVSNLEVLQALTESVTDESDYILAQTQLLQAQAKLMVAVGDIKL